MENLEEFLIKINDFENFIINKVNKTLRAESRTLEHYVSYIEFRRNYIKIYISSEGSLNFTSIDITVEEINEDDELFSNFLIKLMDNQMKSNFTRKKINENIAILSKKSKTDIQLCYSMIYDKLKTETGFDVKNKLYFQNGATSYLEVCEQRDKLSDLLKITQKEIEGF